MKSPFKFLDSYTPADKDLFFGREKEVEELYNLVFKTALVLVYGLSGTGKTSLVSCGLSTRFEGPDWLPFYIRKEDDINVSLRKSLHPAIEKTDKPEDLREIVNELFYTYFRPVYLIFDQFEELFILGSQEEQRKFMHDIRELIDAKLPCKVIFIMREEYIGGFYEFEKELPTIFDHKLRVEPMRSKQVQEVMLKSFEKFNITLEAPEEELCQKIIENISAGKSGIPLTFLQVYLDMLYREDYAKNYPNGADQELPPLLFTKEEIDHFGELGNVLERFLETQLEEIQRKINQTIPEATGNAVHKILDIFVTEEGTKRPIAYRRNNKNLELASDVRQKILEEDVVITTVLEELEDVRILRFLDDTIELSHDSLALIIDRGRTEEQKQLNDARKRIKGEFKAWQLTGEYMSRKRLNHLEDFLPKMELPVELEKFIDDSRIDIERKENEKLEQKEREIRLIQERLESERKHGRRQKIFMVMLSLAFITSLGLGAWAFRQNGIAKKALSDANTALHQKELEENAKNKLKIERLLRQAKTYEEANEPELAIQKIDEILSIDEDNLPAIEKRTELLNWKE